MAAEYEIAVAGGGPAGLTAALFAARLRRRTIVLDSIGMGGALLNAGQVEGWPGLADGVPGFELGPRLQEQALDAGVAVEPLEVGRIEPRGADWCVVTDAREVVAAAIVVATGSRPRPVGVPGEDEFAGKGLSHCASCDGPLYQGRTVAVYGGGDPALVETLELVRHDVRVVLLHPDDDLGGQETFGRRIAESAQVEIRHRTVLEEILGDGHVERVRVRALASGESSTVAVGGVFAYVGSIPNTACLEGVVTLDEHGRVPTDVWMRTERPGLFAVGDVRADA